MIRFTPIGGLDTDTEDLYISSGNYRYALNLRKNSITRGETESLHTLKGNSLILDMDGVTQQQHIIRFHIELDSTYSSEGDVFAAALYNFQGEITSKGVNYAIGTYASPALTGNPVEKVFQLISENLKQLNPTVGLTDPLLIAAFNLVQTTSYTGYFDISASALGNAYFQLFINTSDGTLSTSGDWGRIYTEVIQEGIEVEGDLVPIGSFNNNGTIYLVSTLPDGGIIEIGALRNTLNNPSNSLWSYTRLLRSVEINLHPDYPVSCDGERDPLKDSLYITDGNTSPLKFYLPANNFVTDGGLLSNGGYLVYGSILSQMKLFSSTTSAYIDTITVGSSGAITAGSKRYTGRFMTELLSTTEFLPLTNPVPIFSAKLTDPLNLVGDEPGNVTDKSVSMIVQNIPQNLYKYFELAVVEYNGDSFTQKIVHRYKIPVGATSIEVTHTDIGQDNLDLSIEELSSLRMAYDTAENICLLDNHLIISNLSEDAQVDLSEWAQTFKHYIDVHELPSSGDFGEVWAPSSATATVHDSPNLRLGEYMIPENVTNYTGYMFNDTYRFGVEVKWKSNGKWSKAFWVDDVKIDDSHTNVVGSRRSQACRITGGKLYSNGVVYVYHPVFHDIDFNYAFPEGRISDLVEEIRFVRSPRIPEVLATGLGLLSRPSGNDVFIPTALDSVAIDRKYVYFYSPDHFLGGVAPYKDINNVTLKVTGVNPSTDYVQGVTRVANSLELGHFVQLGQPTNSPNTSRAIDFCDYLVSGSSNNIGSVVFANRANSNSLVCDAMVFRTTTSLNFNQDTAVFQRAFYCQQFLDLGGNEKYPSNKELSTYFPVTKPYTLGTQSEYEIFGGDVFTQRTVVRIFAQNGATFREGLGYSFYSQNRVNSQLRSINVDGDGYVFPQKLNDDFTTATYPANMPNLHKAMSNWLADRAVSEQQFYYTHYNAKDSVLLDTGFDTEDITPKSYPSRVAWSMFKPNASVSDLHTVFQPLSYKDLDLSSGEITHHATASGYLYFWQRDEFRREFFNFMALLRSSEGDIIAGSGDNMSQRGSTISQYGCTNKWSIVRGISRGGDSVFYWFDAKSRKIIRFGSDGVNPISDQQRISSFLQEKYFDSPDTPVSNLGINSVYDAKHGEALFTFKLQDSNRFIDPDLLGTQSITGNVYNWLSGYSTPGIGLSGAEMVTDQMYYSPSSLDKSGVPNIFRYRGGLSSDTYLEPAEGRETYYTLLDPDTLNLHHIFTLVWDEKRGFFRSFFDFYPNLYIPFDNGYISTNPKSRHKLYEHDASTSDLTFYDYRSKYEFKFVFNYDPNLAKIFSGLQYSVDQVPDLVQYRTDLSSGLFGGTEIENLDGFYYSPIITDSRVVGKYLEVTITGRPGEAQKIFNFITKFRPSFIIYQ